MNPPSPANSGFELTADFRPGFAVAHDDEQINVAVFMRIAPGVGAKEINLLRLKLGFQPFNRMLQKAGRNCLHGGKLALRPGLWKPEFAVIERGLGGMRSHRTFDEDFIIRICSGSA